MDLVFVKDLVGGKLPVLGQRNVRPTVLYDFGAEQVSCARNAGGTAQNGSAAAFQPAAGGKIHSVKAGDQAFAEVFGIPIGGDHAFLMIELERVVHFGNIILGQNIVGVQQEEPVEGSRAEIALNAGKQIFQRVSFGAFVGVVIFVNDGTQRAGNFGGFVGAVVGNHKNLQLVLRVIVFANAFDQPGDDVFLVSGRNHNSVAVDPVGFRIALFRKNAHHAENGKMEKERARQDEQYIHNQTDDMQIIHTSFFGRLSRNDPFRSSGHKKQADLLSAFLSIHYTTRAGINQVFCRILKGRALLRGKNGAGPLDILSSI